MVRKSSSRQRHRGGSLASDRVMSNLQSVPCQTHNNLSSPQVEGTPENLSLYQIQSGGSLASDAVMKGLDNPPCCYANAFEGASCQHGGNRKRHSKKKVSSKRKSRKSRKSNKSKKAGGKNIKHRHTSKCKHSSKRKHRHTSKCKHSSKKQAGGKKGNSHKSKKRSHKSKKRSHKSKKRSHKSKHTGGGSSDWGHTNYSLKVGVPDAGEAARFKNFTEAEFQSPSQLYGEPNGVDNPPYAPYDPSCKLEGAVAK
jgi:hypothetical protein